MSFYHVLNKGGLEMDEKMYRRELVEKCRELAEGIIEINDDDKILPYPFGDIKMLQNTISGGIYIELVPDTKTGLDENMCIEELKYRATIRNKYFLKEIKEDER